MTKAGGGRGWLILRVRIAFKVCRQVLLLAYRSSSMMRCALLSRVSRMWGGMSVQSAARFDGDLENAHDIDAFLCLARTRHNELDDDMVFRVQVEAQLVDSPPQDDFLRFG